MQVVVESEWLNMATLDSEETVTARVDGLLLRKYEDRDYWTVMVKVDGRWLVHGKFEGRVESE